MRAAFSRTWRALSGFLRGFLGLGLVARDPAATRRALARRAANRRGCC